MTTTVSFNIPFEVVVEAIKALDIEKQRALFEVLDDLLFEAEELSMEADPTVLREVEEARQAYQQGDYQTIQEYIAIQMPPS